MFSITYCQHNYHNHYSTLLGPEYITGGNISLSSAWGIFADNSYLKNRRASGDCSHVLTCTFSYHTRVANAPNNTVTLIGWNFQIGMQCGIFNQCTDRVGDFISSGFSSRIR